jgi:hypothetical protein
MKTVPVTFFEIAISAEVRESDLIPTPAGYANTEAGRAEAIRAALTEALAEAPFNLIHLKVEVS